MVCWRCPALATAERTQDTPAADAAQARASRALAAPRYRAPYRSWCMLGDDFIDSAICAVLPDAIECGTSRIECEVFARPYLHLFNLVGAA